MRKFLASSLLAILICGFTIPENDFVSKFKEKVNLFNENYKRAKLDIVFNQPKYAPGDTAYFRTLYAYAANLHLIPGRQIVNVELYDSSGSMVMKNQVLVINGIGKNQMVIPASLKPGVYQLVSHSNWMRNFDSSLFFHQNFIISGANEFKTQQPTNVISFFPEGGRLVKDIENNLIVRLSLADSLKNFVVKDLSGHAVAQGQLNKFGYGQFNITPGQNEKYTFDLVGKDIKSFSVPSAFDSGVSLQLSKSESGVLEIKLNASQNISIQNKNYAIAFINASGLVASSLLSISETSPSLIKIPNDLPSGITNIIVLNSHSEILAERLIYKKPTSLNVQIKKLNATYQPRDSIKVEISVLDKNNNPVAGRFSVRVVNRDLFKNSKPTSSSNLLIQTDVPFTEGQNELDPEDESFINLFLATQPCNWLKGNDLMKEQITPPKYKVQEYLEIKGTAKFIADDKPLRDSTLISLFLENQTKGYETIIKNGAFKLSMILDPLGTDRMFYCATSQSRDVRNFYIQMDNLDSSYRFKAVSFKEGSSTDLYTSFISKSKIIDKSFSFYQSKHKKNSKEKEFFNPNESLEEEFGGVDLEVNLNDYVVFPTMADVIREILPAVEYRKINNRDVLRLYTTQKKKPTNFTGPLIVIDGSLTKDPQKLLSLDPQYVSSIKLIKESSKLMRFGALCPYGVIIVRTKYPFIKNQINEKNTFDFIGLNKSINTVPSKEKVKEKLTPDLRPFLYWNADMELNNQGIRLFSLSTSDDVAEYDIIIEGISNNGILFYKKGSFAVKF